MTDRAPRTIEFHRGALTPDGGDASTFVLGCVPTGIGLAGGLVLLLSPDARGVGTAAAVVVALGLGLLILGLNRAYVFDRERRTLSIRRALFALPLGQHEVRFADVRAARAVSPVRDDENLVVLELRDGQRLTLLSVHDPHQARADADRVARFCGLEGGAAADG